MVVFCHEFWFLIILHFSFMFVYFFFCCVLLYFVFVYVREWVFLSVSFFILGVLVRE